MNLSDLIDYVKQNYDAVPEYLWPDYPQTFIFRHASNRKWFGVVMDVECGKLGLPGEGKSLDRPGYQALKNVILRPGDTLVIKSLDRLSRNRTDIRNELQFFNDQGIRLKVIDLPTTMMDLPEGQSC